MFNYGKILDRPVVGNVPSGYALWTLANGIEYNQAVYSVTVPTDITS
ncbi:hypothetical protein [Pseudobutyrivibrio xylanivorans]|nr:hypothetical protein [Pseudobutyrivibrio xylanivorans]